MPRCGVRYGWTTLRGIGSFMNLSPKLKGHLSLTMSPGRKRIIGGFFVFPERSFWGFGMSFGYGKAIVAKAMA